MTTALRPRPIPAEPATTLGALLRAARHRRGDSQRRLAERLCAAAGMPTVSRHEVSRWERELRLPSAYWLGFLAQVLLVDRAVLDRAAAGGRRRAGRPVPGGAPRRAWAWRLVEIDRVADASGVVVLRPRAAGGPGAPPRAAPDTVAA
jgi:transcriptional regulator with XRE-family HTH domain